METQHRHHQQTKSSYTPTIRPPSDRQPNQRGSPARTFSRPSQKRHKPSESRDSKSSSDGPTTRGKPIGKPRREGEHRSVSRRSRRRRSSNSTKASVNAKAHSWSRCARKRSGSRISSSTEEYRASPTPTAHAGKDDKRNSEPSQDDTISGSYRTSAKQPPRQSDS
ncbi:uncharacterized protein BDZ83DRAFT_638808 [Colletotrichum acutatum]|uniref:Uncharacterized protein n=1 Tax=Glomerella acutata TaxID=27357 RepID=A0AAD8UCL8_GLOAC|nr:uncharacterized protein BDZ83DRAFT_638808 [Colletotrichum acutatum]KAK1712237.1 hypothetical protein BDZ83DRAFT_638808 [Colletotrichum acutatum]